MNNVQRFERNTTGRDFVVGDIHGCFDAMRELMTTFQFDEAADRMFSVGDLVDRGTQSEESIDWIAKPWFHAVRGNHEQMAIGVAAGRHDLANYLQNGGGWFLSMTDDRQRLYADAFDSLPYAIEIGTEDGLVGIVHAECGDSWPAFCDALDNSASKTRLRNVTETALWSRTKITRCDDSEVEGLRYLVVGHTPLERPQRLGNVVYIDTGAVFGKYLTAIELTYPLTIHYVSTDAHIAREPAGGEG